MPTRSGQAGGWPPAGLTDTFEADGFSDDEPSQAVMRRIGLTEVARWDYPRVPDGHPLKPHVTYHRARLAQA